MIPAPTPAYVSVSVDASLPPVSVSPVSPPPKIDVRAVAAAEAIGARVAGEHVVAAAARDVLDARIAVLARNAARHRRRDAVLRSA